MIGWVVAAVCASVAVWALYRASYWKWMWEGERKLNQALMRTAQADDAPAVRLGAGTVTSATGMSPAGPDGGRSN
jgi:hypothetical protein